MDSCDVFDLLNEIVNEMISAKIPRPVHPCLLSKQYNNAFSGQDFVMWFSKAKDADEAKSLEMGSQLIKMKFFIPLSNSSTEVMQNSPKVFYRLNEPSSTHVLNSGSVKDCVISDGGKLSEALRKLVLKMYGTYISEDGKTVDYQAMKASSSFGDYEDLAKHLQRVPVEDMTEDERKAFFINIYNALVVHATAVYGPPMGFLARMNFYKKMRYSIGGFDYSLDDIENGVLRGNKRGAVALFPSFRRSDPRRIASQSQVDPRIHFALNCGAKSCPPIKAYSAEGINEELQLATEGYLENDDGVAVVYGEGNPTVNISSLFRWYKSDFGESTKEVLQWILSNFRRGEKRDILEQILKSNQYTVSYLSYDWGSNGKE